MKYEIEIEGLPEGWEPVAYRKPTKGADYVFENGRVFLCKYDAAFTRLTVKKKQSRRIILEETTEENYRYRSGQYKSFCIGEFIISGPKYVWREVKESDSSLTKDDPKLSLTVDECKEVMSLHNHGSIKKKLINKISEFLKDK